MRRDAMCAGRPAAGMRRLAQLPESEVHWWSTVGSSRQHCKAIVAKFWLRINN